MSGASWVHGVLAEPAGTEADGLVSVSTGAGMKTESPEDLAFKLFASVYPHEAHAQDPERFFALVERVKPGIPRAAVKRMLRETAEP